MTGYCYGEPEPTAECGCCGGEARAEWCDVGVGNVQITPFQCLDCDAVLDPIVDGVRMEGWIPAEAPRAGAVTGYYVNDRGIVVDMTFDRGHAEYNALMDTTTSALLARGWVRITNLEGYAIDLPCFMTARTRRALSDLMKRIDNEARWGLPYVMASGAQHGREMTYLEAMAIVSALPFDTPGEASGMRP